MDVGLRKDLRWLWMILGVTTTITVFFACRLELTDQEAYYWTWSKALDFSYFDHPPLQAWTTAVLTSVFGDQVWVVRLPAIIGHLVTLAIFYAYCRKRYEQRTAILSTLAILATPFFTLGSVVALPDALAAPLGLATLYYSDQQKPGRASFCFGLAGLAKWTSVFFLPGYIYALYQSKIKRKWLYLVIPAVLQAPVIYWNIEHHGASLLFHLSERHNHHLLSLSKYLEHLGTFFGLQLFAGGVGLIILGVLFVRQRAWTAHPPQAGGARHAIFWCLPAFAIVGLSALQGEIRFYWTGIAFFPLFAFMIARLRFTSRGESALVRTLGLCALLNLALISVAMLVPVGPFFEQAFHLKPDARHSPRGDIAGWCEWVEQDLIPNGIVSPRTAFMATNFRLAAQVAWATRVNIFQTSTVSGTKNQYQYWPAPSTAAFDQSVFVGDNRYGDLKLFDGLCAAPIQWREHDVVMGGQVIKKISWALCSKPRF